MGHSQEGRRAGDGRGEGQRGEARASEGDLRIEMTSLVETTEKTATTKKDADPRDLDTLDRKNLFDAVSARADNLPAAIRPRDELHRKESRQPPGQLLGPSHLERAADAKVGNLRIEHDQARRPIPLQFADSL